MAISFSNLYVHIYMPLFGQRTSNDTICSLSISHLHYISYYQAMAKAKQGRCCWNDEFWMPCTSWTSVTFHEYMYWVGVKDCERLWPVICVFAVLIYLWGLSLTVAARAERRAVLTLEVSTIWKVIWLKSYCEFKLYFHLINFHWYWQSIVIFPWI